MLAAIVYAVATSTDFVKPVAVAAIIIGSPILYRDARSLLSRLRRRS